MPQNALFPRTCDLLVSKNWHRHFYSTLHPLSLVIFATATVLAFVLLRNSRFNFHCYTQHEATPTQKLARKWCCDFLHESLQRVFTHANQLHWTTQWGRLFFFWGGGRYVQVCSSWGWGWAGCNSIHVALAHACVTTGCCNLFTHSGTYMPGGILKLAA